MNNIVENVLQGLRVAVVDDHEVVLEGIRSYLMRHGIACVSAYQSAKTLLDGMRHQRYDLFLIDVELSDMDVCALIDNIRDLQPNTRIIINTMHEELWVVRKMMEKGVDGVVYKSGNLEQMLRAIYEVAEGNTYFNPKYKHSQARIELQDHSLTRREMEVLNLVAKGLSSKEIARKLFISENTVETHRQNIFSKMGVHNVADLLVRAISEGYIRPISFD
jgi:DNA-binding NarL/FixJ family response regulator